jgi:hypothetical protein
VKPRAVVLLVIAVAVCVLVVGLLSGALVGRLLSPSTERPRIADTPTLIRQIQSMAQLVSVRYVLEKVVVLEDVKWYGENRLIMVAHGVAKAGFDLSQLQPGDIKVRGQRLSLTLPKPQLTDVYLDEKKTEVVERSTGLLRAFDHQLEQDARRQALEQIQRAARNSGIMKDAEDRARVQLTGFFQQLGFAEVEVTTR